MKKRILSLILIFALVFAAGCARKKEKLPDIEDEYEYSEDEGVDFSSPKNFFVSNSTSEYKIVIPQNADEAEDFAAKELRDFIRQSTSALLTVVTDSGLNANKDQKLISIGRTSLLNSVLPNVDYSGFNGDGFIIRTEGNLIFINGASSRGTLYGVYDFLEKFVGVKFISGDYTYVPQQDELYIHSLNITEIPVFPSRCFFQMQIMQNPLFAARSRMISFYSQNIAAYGGGYLTDWDCNNFHNFMVHIPPDEFLAAHEDWYSLAYEVDGKKHYNLCLTSGITDADILDENMEESAVKEMIASVKKSVTEMPTVKNFFIGQEDTGGTCNCSRCGKSAGRNGNNTGVLMVWINIIAEEIEKWAKEEYPGREINIVTFSYQWSLSAPVKTDPATKKTVAVNDKVIPRKNVIIYYAASSSCFYHSLRDTKCTKNASARAHLDGWTAITDRLCIYTYGTNFAWHPWYFPNLNSLKENLIYYRNIGGVAMVTDQGAPRETNYYDMRMKGYLLAKLMWNPARDVNKIIADFNKYYFGEEAGAYVDQYVDLMERHFAVLNAREPFCTDLYEGGVFTNATYYPAGLLERAMSIIKSGMATVEQSGLPDADKRVLNVRLMRAYIQPQFMTLRNFASYYDDSLMLDYARDFFKNVNTAGMVNIRESASMDWYKGEFGLV